MAIKLKKHQKFCIFLMNNVYLLKILLSNLIFLLFPKFLELLFTHKNTPPKVKNSKMGLNHIFLGTPCRNMFLGSNIPYLFVRCHSFQSFFLTLPLRGKWAIRLFCSMVIFSATDKANEEAVTSLFVIYVYWIIISWALISVPTKGIGLKDYTVDFVRIWNFEF